VAGTSAAVNNTEGVVGIAPEAKLWAVRVLDNRGSGSWSSVICGIDFVTSKAPANGGPITVANMSLGGTGSDDGNCGLTNNDALHQAICRSVAAGVTYVVAAGNETDNAAKHVPAAYDEVITVSALSDSDGKSGGTGGAPSCRTSEKDDYFASFSNFGADVDIAAPGVCVLSTWKGGGYNTISGTSMASPHVAGVAALYIATHPGATPAQVRDALIAAQEPGPIPGDPDTFKEGVVNAGGF
jgi:subtilisin family serine protease